ncbi:hypothetical protein K435DRAFT_868403 [Dendrothele bispora CBS 962.96]|uniref:Uncharacterized protein n=1 Tax=Dendrothele bispora (strain CBS 962.96) TaxID=1314807 RepID=A0A4S8LD80_DENBC|nr:hypothetical protein K435DRAFT_868403 [Dendrothele bispora CBS 962.96]
MCHEQNGPCTVYISLRKAEAAEERSNGACGKAPPLATEEGLKHIRMLVDDNNQYHRWPSFPTAPTFHKFAITDNDLRSKAPPLRAPSTFETPVVNPFPGVAIHSSEYADRHGFLSPT